MSFLSRAPTWNPNERGGFGDDRRQAGTGTGREGGGKAEAEGGARSLNLECHLNRSPEPENRRGERASQKTANHGSEIKQTFSWLRPTISFLATAAKEKRMIEEGGEFKFIAWLL